jgi:hypothetical protein
MPANEAPLALAVPKFASRATVAVRALVVASVALFSPACFSTDDGVAPPADQLNYPVGVALDPSGDRLFVASSDFDLRYNGGLIQVFDAAEIRRHLPQSCTEDSDCPSGSTCPHQDGKGSTLCVDDSGSICGELGEQAPTQLAKHPGACNALDVERGDVLLDSARIGPFVADVKYIEAAADGSRSARIVMPVRGDATLHWADVKSKPTEGGAELECGQAERFGDCDDAHRRGDGADEVSPAGDKLPTEPFGLAVSPDGTTLFVGHQSQGKVSVFSNGKKGPELQTVLSGLPSNPMGIAVVPKRWASTTRSVRW